MKNSKLLLYYCGIIGSFIAMIIHIRLMTDTNNPIHLVCLGLWFVICCCLILIFRHKLTHDND